MICPSCGSDCPDGSALCPNCGGDLMDVSSSNVQPAFNVNDALFNGGGNSISSEPIAPPKKKSNGVLSAIITVIVIIAIAAAVLVAGGVKYMGTYKLESVTADVYGTGIPTEVRIADYPELGITEDTIQLKIGLFGRANLTADTGGGSVKIKYNGNDMTIKASDGDVSAKYNPSTKTIEMDFTEIYRQEIIRQYEAFGLSDSDLEGIDMTYIVKLKKK